MEENLSLPKQRVFVVFSTPVCANILGEFSASQKMYGETLDNRYKYLLELYYDLLAMYRQTSNIQMQRKIADELESFENELAHILLEFDASAENLE